MFFHPQFFRILWCGQWYFCLRGLNWGVIRSTGILVSLPNIKKCGENPVEVCTVDRYANNAWGKHLSQSSWRSLTNFERISFRVQFIHSTRPSLWGWYGVVWVLFIPRISIISLKTALSKFLPRCVCSRCMTSYPLIHQFLCNNMCFLIWNCVRLQPFREIVHNHQYITITIGF